MRNGSGRKPAFGASRQYRRHLGHHVGQAYARSGRRGRARWFRQGPSGHHYVSGADFTGRCGTDSSHQRDTVWGRLSGCDCCGFFRCGPVLQKLRRIHRQGCAGGRKRMAVFRYRPLRSEEAGQQTDRKYAAAAMWAFVSLQMQGMPQAFEALPAFFIRQSGVRKLFQTFPKERGTDLLSLFMLF